MNPFFIVFQQLLMLLQWLKKRRKLAYLPFCMSSRSHIVVARSSRLGTNQALLTSSASKTLDIPKEKRPADKELAMAVKKAQVEVLGQSRVTRHKSILTIFRTVIHTKFNRCKFFITIMHYFLTSNLFFENRQYFFTSPFF